MPQLPPLKPVVSEQLPNTAQALQASGATQDQQDMVTALAYAYQKGNQLRKLPQNVAQNEFNKLSAPAQADVKSLFGNDPYLQTKPSLLSSIEKGIKNSVASLISPLGFALFKAAPAYSKIINAPARAGFEVATLNKPLYSADTWSSAYSGKDLYNPNDVAMLQKKYGNATAAVAMGVVAGKTPSEIMQGYSKGGAWDPELGKAIAASLDDPNFQKIIDDVKLARFNPGNALIRDTSNYGEATPPHSGGVIARSRFQVLAQQWAAVHQGKKYDPNVNFIPEDTKSKMLASGVINFAYQLVVDPMTWAGGGDKAVMVGQRLANSVQKAAEEGRLAEGVAGVFKNKQVVKLWDEQVGPAIQKIVDAKTPVEKAAAYENFKFAAPSYNERSAIKALINGGMDGKPITNAKLAQKFFEDPENTHLLVNGRVDGTNFYRNSVATARNNRIISQGRAAAIDAIFNPSLKNLTTQEAIKAAEAKGEEVFKTLSKVGDTTEQGINPDVVKLQEMYADMSKTRRAATALGTMFARSPSRGFILYGPDAEKTIDNFINTARLVVPRDQAKILAEHYVTAEPNEQLAMVRNLHFAYMQKQGLEGFPKGRDIIEEQLNKTMNAAAGMGSSGTIEAPDHIARVASKNTFMWRDDKAVVANTGAHQPSQLTNAVGPLDYMAINQARRFTREHALVSGFDKVTQNRILQTYTNLWSFFTLIPRLGIRGSADEIFMYIFNQPMLDVMRFVGGGARKEANVLNMVSGSKESVGPIKRAINVMFRKGGPEDYLTLEKRSQIIDNLVEKLSTKYGRPIAAEEIANFLKREETASRMWDVVFGDLPAGMQGDKEAIINAIKHQPDFLQSMVNSLTARTSMTGLASDTDIRAIMFEPSAVDKALKEEGERLNGKGIKAGKKFNNYKVSDLERSNKRVLSQPENPWYQMTKEEKDRYLQKWTSLSHFDNYGLRFAYNSIGIASGTEEGAGFVFSPVTAFFKNGALKTDHQFEQATKDLLQDVGVKHDASINDVLHTVENPKRLNSFNSMFGDSLLLKQKGLNSVEIARVHIETMLTDMYRTLHGDGSFNQKFYDRIKSAYDGTFVTEPKKLTEAKRWEIAAKSLDFQEFDKLTVNKHPTLGGVNTRLEFPDVAQEDGESFFKKFGNHAFEAMDRQINGLFRQRALLITYTRIYKENKPFMDLFERKMREVLSESKMYSTERVNQEAKLLAEKRYTEISMSEATSTILKYADNPEIRSNFSISASSVGRFYRANEDFQRRAYRMGKDAPLRALYRMRLLNTGFSASGFVYTDNNQNPYIVAPTDSVLYAPTASVMKIFYPGATDAYKSAQFDEVKMKLELINPSFSGDSGEPMFSGPASAIAIWAMRGILDTAGTKTGISALTNAGTDLNTLALGSIGNNITLRKALVPMFLDNVYQMLSPTDTSREMVTAGMQAMNYMTAYGNGLPANPTAKQKRDFVQNVRTAAHSILFIRALLGIVSPITPTLTESKGLPGYYKAGGVTGLRPEFFQILKGIQDTYGTDVQDPYALASAIFIGQNPGKSIYTASRNNKSYHVLVNANIDMMNWSIANSDFVSTYNDAALVFAPQIGKFNNNVYAWMQSQDMATLPSIDAYFQNASVTAAKDAYFKVSSDEQAALTNNLDLSARKQIIDQAAQQRAMILAGNPMLVEDLGSTTGNGKGRDQITFDNIKAIIADPKSPINKNDRTMMFAATKIMDGFLGIAQDPEFKGVANFKEIALEARQKAEASLQDLAKINPAVAEAYNYVFKGVMNAYVPDKATVLSKGN